VRCGSRRRWQQWQSRLPTMPRGAIHTVEYVPQQVDYLTVAGHPRVVFMTKWQGYPLTEATFEPRASFGPPTSAVMQLEVLPLEARVKQEGQLELQEHRRQSIARVQHQLRDAIQRYKGEAARDKLVSCLCRLEPRTAHRLFTARLQLLCRSGTCRLIILSHCFKAARPLRPGSCSAS
jgi:hypothetical protein